MNLNKIFKRSFTNYRHYRDIQCKFDNQMVIYRIPIYFEEEQAALGKSLEIQINLDKVDSIYTVKKTQVGDPAISLYKTQILLDYFYNKL